VDAVIRVGFFSAELLTPQSGGARNCGPTGDFAANVVCKLIRPGVERIKTQLAKPFHCFRRMYRLLCSVGEFFNHRPWRARGRQEAEPEAKLLPSSARWEAHWSVYLLPSPAP
jgi:hypothetical protein